MISLLLHLLRLLPFLFGGHRQLALENLALRHQLAVYKRTGTRPRLRRTDRLFWVALATVWAGWKQSLVIVTPDTVLRWQRRRFRDQSQFFVALRKRRRRSRRQHLVIQKLLDQLVSRRMVRVVSEKPLGVQLKS